MATAVFFYADHDDTLDLMRYLGLGRTVSLHPWPLVKQAPVHYTVDEAIAAESVMVESSEFGGPVLLRDGDSAFNTAGRAGLFKPNQSRAARAWSERRPSGRPEPVAGLVLATRL